MSDHREDTLRELAATATPGPWEAYFTTHGDPYVVEAGKGLFGAITGGTVSTAPDDYGRANCEYIAAANPAIAASMASVISAARTVADRIEHEDQLVPEWAILAEALAEFDGSDG